MNKKIRHALRIGTLAASLVLACPAQADLAGAFTVPPFKLNESIVGIEGWELRLPRPEDDGFSARMIAVRWDEGKPALLIDGVSLTKSFPPVTGSKVKVTIILALTFPRVVKLRPFRISIGAPFREFVLDAKGGLGFGDGTGQSAAETIVPLDQLKPNSYYTISILVDNDAFTYDLDVTGQKLDGTPLSYQKKGVAFDSKNSFLKSVYIISSNSVRVYMKELSIESL